jgi:hypothetical protein
MAAVAGPVAPAAAVAAPSKADAMQVDAGGGPTTAEEEDLYTRLKGLQRQLEFLEIQVRFESSVLRCWARARALSLSLSCPLRARLSMVVA